MNKKPNNSKQISKQAKKPIVLIPDNDCRSRSAEELLHELQVHQVELEMQNEDLRLTQIELEKSRDRYIDFYDFSTIGYITLNHKAMIEEINLTGTKLLGMDRSKLIHRRFAPFVAPLDRDRWNLYFLSVLKNDDIQECELEFLRKDGSSFYGLLNCILLKKNDENPVVRIVLTDITKLKQAKAAILDTNIELQATFAAIPDLLFEIGMDGRYYKCHAHNTDLLAKPCDEILGKTIFEVLPQEAAQTCMSALQEASVKGRSYGKQICLPLQQGNHWFELSVAPKNEEENQDKRFIVLSRDITMRKQAEVDLRIAAVAFESQESLMITDAKGVILRVNKAFTKITGFTAKEAVGHTPHMLHSDMYNKFFYHGMWKTLKLTGSWHGEIWGRRKNGELYLKWLTISAVKADGVVTHYVGADTDITELSNAKFAAEKANRAKSEFISSMSHELRTPLNAILGFAQLLERGSPEPTAPQMTKIKEIIRGGWYLLDLINEILDLSSIESGKVSLSPEFLSLPQLLLECKAMMDPQAKLRNIQLNFAKINQSIYVYGDRTRLKQVLINLLSNAIKYNREHGTVDLTCNTNVLKQVRISISDNGDGLSPENLAQLFQPFNRLGKESTSVEGTGIGLVVCKKLLEQMNGNIGVESTVGVGSVFWFEMPVADEIPLVAVSDESETCTQKKYDLSALRTLMYIEDNPASLSLIEHIIEGRPGIRLLSAMNGNVGIELAITHLPDVILMDINLPGINGVEVIKNLRGNPSTKHMPVIALSAEVNPDGIENAIEAGVFRYLTKPLNLDDFLNAIDEALKMSNE
ncbi:MAG: PAS domain S-box protein [Candidatus Nitrotoga sp.]